MSAILLEKKLKTDGFTYEKYAPKNKITHWNNSVSDSGICSKVFSTF
jgi:hypothetical protein